MQSLSDRIIHQLPLMTLYLTERCNSKCISCDYWRYGTTDLTGTGIASFIAGVRQLNTKVVLISGGEPLLNPHWADIAAELRAAGLKLWLLTSGLSLYKHADRIMSLFESVTVSLDGADALTYRTIRGVDAFEPVCAGIRTIASYGMPTSIRVTVQRANYHQLPALADLAKNLGARHISFLAADVSNRSAFGRGDASTPDIALQPSDCSRLQTTLTDMTRSHAADFASGFIAESPGKLQRILRYYSALCGDGAFPTVRCNAPEHSAVLDAAGKLRPCFFIAGPDHAAPVSDLTAALNDPAMRSLRASIARGERSECQRCVCSMWFDGAALSP
jgi:MoaA/NifB/PqqE/SkfB family radical SAM enzyme